MKKYFVFILMICFMFTACSGKDNERTVLNQSMLVSNNNQNSFIAEDEKYVYYYSIFDVYKMSKNDNIITNIYTLSGSNNTIISTIEYFDGRIYMIFGKDIISIDTNGENELKSDASEIYSKDSGNNSNNLPVFYTYNNELYLVSKDTNTPYKINADNLHLEAANKEILNTYIFSSEITFNLKIENGHSGIYIKDSNGDETLFSSDSENVILNSVNYADKYVFYLAYNLSTPDIFNLYRVNVSNNSKELIKELDLKLGFVDVVYDEGFIYLTAGEHLYKIDKETFNEKDISDILKKGSGFLYEIVNEKIFFFLGETTCLDTVSGENIV